MNVKKGQIIVSRPRMKITEADMRKAAALFDAVRRLENREEEVWMPPADGSWKEKYEALLKHHDATTRVMKQKLEMLIIVQKTKR